MHQPAITHGSQQEGKLQIEAEHARTKIALRHRNRVPGPERHIVEDAAILAQGNFAFGAAIKVVKYRFWQSFPRDGPEVINANDARRSYSGFRHGMV
jgi:hypothetical protein